jgi:2-polyprenyl-3-methyl-5-hydroxy-6-metoxy-1,4-benzoquinol methylase
MNKNIFLVASPNEINPYKNALNFDTVNIAQLDTLINSFHGVIYVGCLENIPTTEHETLVTQLINKLRPGGELILSITNRKAICQLYLDNTIGDNDFHTKISLNQYPVSTTGLSSLVQKFNNAVISKNINSGTNTYIHIIKTKI